MTKFNYKKWIVENKFGKAPSYSNYSVLNEQTGSIDTGSISEETQTWYNQGTCSPCPEGNYIVSSSVNLNNGEPQVVDMSSVSSNCLPVISGEAVEIPTSIITGAPWDDDFDGDVGTQLAHFETSLSFEEFSSLYGGGSGWVSLEPINPTYCMDPQDFSTGNPSYGSEVNYVTFQGVCCDPDSPNYGQTNIPGYNIQQNESNALDTSLMFNVLEGEFCDNSICTGAEAELTPTPDMEKAPFKDKSKRRDPRDQRNRDPRNQRNRDPRTNRRLREVIKQVLSEEIDGQYGLDIRAQGIGTGSGPTPNPNMNTPQGMGASPSRGPERAAGGSNSCTKADVMKALGNPKNMGQAVQGYTRLYAKHRGTCADGKPLPSPQSVKQKYSSRPNDPVEPKFMIWIMTAIFCIGTYCLTGGYGTWEE
tara:strand:+ start:2596 stop:3852 length:1257 start_codon:yes stop_codon:yes gene_type:complete